MKKIDYKEVKKMCLHLLAVNAAMVAIWTAGWLLFSAASLSYLPYFPLEQNGPQFITRLILIIIVGVANFIVIEHYARSLVKS